MDKRTLERTIDTLSKVISITEEQKKNMYTKYIDMNEKDVIKDLAKAAYRLLGPNSPYYDYVLTIIRNIKPDICPPIEKFKEVLNKMFTNEIDGNMSMEENHELINTTLYKACTLMNEAGIDYYIVGALPCFIKAGIPLFRYHDDIDIMVNENDIPKTREIMEMMGYKFQDDRFPTVERYEEMQKHKPPHTVLAQNPDNEFHIGFFCFRREPDNSITKREYEHRLENGEVKTDVLERRNGVIGTELKFDDHPISFAGTTFRAGSLEDTYHLKQCTSRPKDLTDMAKLAPYIDQAKLEEIKKHPAEEIMLRGVLKEGAPGMRF
jgi:hypothetical protein